MANKKITDLQLISAVTDGLNFPGDDSIQSYRATALQLWNYIYSKMFASTEEVKNLTITTSVATSALTVALKTKAGTDASSTDKIRISFRSSTLTSGSFNLREITGALSMVVSSGSTLGQTSGQPSYIWVYLIDNAGTPELAVSRRKFPEDALVSTTAEGGAGAADSPTVMYSTTARTSVPVRCIGYILNTQATAGTWASAGTQIQLAPFNRRNLVTMTAITSAGSSTYNTPAGCTRLEVIAVAAGGGGAGSATGSANNGGSGVDGGNTTFGSSLITCVGGTKGVKNAIGGAGGGFTINSPAVGIGYQGGLGGGSFNSNSVIIFANGGDGGGTMIGPRSAGGFNGAGQNGSTNSGAGGGGAGIGANSGGSISGGGGGGGGGARAVIVNPDSSYTAVVGAKGAGGSAGTSGFVGGDAADGALYIFEFYD
jgi:hypothetical protein